MNEKYGNPSGKKLKLLALEQRIALDAAAADTLMTETLQPQEEPQSSEENSPSIAPEDLARDPVQQSNTNEIVFIDSSVVGVQDFLDNVDPNIEVVIMDANSDGVEQIANALQGRENLDAVHIISHGRPGTLDLGTAKLTEASIANKYADAITVIGEALSEDADLLIYGCNFGDQARGNSAVEALANATGADVAASEDLTGHADLGGDWDLEIEAGVIEARSLSADNWDGILVAPNAPTGADAGTINFVSGEFRVFVAGGNTDGTGAQDNGFLEVLATNGGTFSTAENQADFTVTGATGDGSADTTTITFTNTTATYSSSFTTNDNAEFRTTTAGGFIAGNTGAGIFVEPEQGGAAGDFYDVDFAFTTPVNAFSLDLVDIMDTVDANNPVFRYEILADGVLLGAVRELALGDDATGIVDVLDANLNVVGQVNAGQNIETTLGFITFSDVNNVTIRHVVESGFLDPIARDPHGIDSILLSTDLNDTDGDGVANINDVDDDNDGILDVVENSPGLTSFGNSTGGTGSFQDDLFWVPLGEPGSSLLDGLSEGDTITVNTPDGGTVKFTFTNVIDLNGGLTNPAGYTPSGIPTQNGIFGTQLSQLYQSSGGALFASAAGPGTNNEVSFTLDYEYRDANGVIRSVPLVLADAEDTDGFDESLQFITNGSNWVELESGGTGSVATGVGTNTVTVTDSVNGVTLYQTENASTIDITINPNTYLGGQGVGFALNFSNITIDSDGDGIADHLDIDKDNDGITDNVEAQATDLYEAPSGIEDGITDLNMDGLDDNYDDRTVTAGTTAATAGAGNGAGLIEVDTDGDSAVDTLDTDSDNDGLSDAAERGDGQLSLVATGKSEAITDADGDGLFDVFEDGTTGDGFDVNDQNVRTADDATVAARSEYNLDDTPALAADLSNVDGTRINLAYRDGDTDNDGIIDSIDVDDDNDGILDTVEGYATSGSTTNRVVIIADDSSSINASEQASMSASIQALITELNSRGAYEFAIIQYGQFDGFVGMGDYSIVNGYASNPTVALTFNNTLLADHLPDSIDKMIDDGIFDTGGTLENPDAFFVFTDAARSDNNNNPDPLFADISVLVDEDDANSPTALDGYGEYQRLASAYNSVISAYHTNPLATEEASGISQNGGEYIFRNTFNVSAADIQTLADSIENNIADTTQDSDNDGIADHLDIDKDNDGITDNVEAQTTDGYRAATLTGGILDANSDGLDDRYDDRTVAAGTAAATEGAGNGAGLIEVDTDSDSTVDTLDTDSDNDGLTDAAERGDGQQAFVATGVSDSTTDADGDGLFDVFEDGTTTDGFDVNDQNVTTADNATVAARSEYNLDDTLALAADLSNVDGTRINLAYRDGDTDNDGIIDSIDIDDDNDGILDVDEGATFRANTTDWTIVSPTEATRTVQYGNETVTITATLSNISTGSNLSFNGTNHVESPNLRVNFSGATADQEALITITSSNPSLPIGLRFSDFDSSLLSSSRETIQYWDPINAVPDNIPTGWTQSDASNLSNPSASGPGTRIHQSNQQTDNVGANGTFTFSDTAGQIQFIFCARVNTPLGGSIGGNVGIEVLSFGSDADADGKLDHLDIDKDNDGITDNAEAQATDLYEAPSGIENGITDLNMDGLDDNYDDRTVTAGTTAATAGAGNGAGLIEVDTDADGTVDTLDTDSDNDGLSDAAERGDGQQAFVATDVSNNTTDADGDGLFDVFEAGTTNDGFDVNDQNVTIVDDATVTAKSEYNLDDTPALAADLSNVDSTRINLAYRDGDTDNDGIIDSIDIDDDNDGILDVDEGATFRANTTDWTIVSPTEATRTVQYGNETVTITATLSNISTGSNLSFNGTNHVESPNLRVNFSGATADQEALITITSSNPSLPIGLRFSDFDSSLLSSSRETIQYWDPINAVPDNIPTGWTQSDASNLSNPSASGPGTRIHQSNQQTDNVGANGTFTFSDTAGQIQFIFCSRVNTPLGGSIGGNVGIEVLSFGSDSDADGKLDHLDIDSDNDGITDNVEAQTTAGYIAPSGIENGITDANGDGLDDIYDAGIIGGGGANGVGLTPVDTDSDGEADYIDTDSDGDTLSDQAESGQIAASSTADSDGDGLLDDYEGANINDGFDVNNENIIGDNGGLDGDYTNFVLPDSDADTNANEAVANRTMNDAIPLVADLDFRDNVLAVADTFDSPAAGLTNQSILANDDPSLTQVDSITLENGTVIPIDVSGGPQTINLVSPTGAATGGTLIINTDYTFDYVPGTEDSEDLFYTASTPGGITSTVRLTIAVDTDGDGVMNVDDVDDDNDGILDVIENGENNLEFSFGGTVKGGLDRGAPDDENRDFVFGDNFSFDLSFDYPTRVQILTTVGDQSNAKSGTVTVDGVSEPVSTTAASFQTVTHMPSDSDTYSISMSGTDLSVTTIVVQDLFGNELAAFDFGQAGSPVAVGYIPVTPSSSGVVPIFANDTDTDGDGIIDRLDIDADNDGIPDNIEAQSSGGYVEPTGLGLGITDTNGDGFDDVYDSRSSNLAVDLTGFADATAADTLIANPQNSDGDSLDDYRDLDSDNDGAPDIKENGFATNSVNATDPDTDKDGLLDAFEGLNANDGFDVNDELVNGSGAIILPDVDGDAAASTPTTQDFDYRDVNLPPVATPSTSSGNEDTDIAVTLVGTDTDGNVDLVTIVTLPNSAQGILYLSDGLTTVMAGTPITAAQAANLIFKPATNFHGTVTIPFTVTDDLGAVSTTSANEVITVIPTPDAVDDPITINEGAAATNVSPLGNDDLGAGTDGVDDVTITTAPTAAQGTLTYTPDGGGSPVTVSNGDTLSATEAATLEFTPTANFSGNVTIPYVLTDSNGATSNANINITVTPIPNAVDDPITINEDAPATNVSPLGNDDLGAGTDGVDDVTITTAPTAAQGTLTYTPDGGGSPVTVSNGDTLSATEAGTLQFTPTADFNGPVTIPYVLTDSNGATSNANINITVTPTPDAIDDPITINEGAAATNVNPLGNDDLGAGTDGVDDVTITTAPTAAQGTLTFVDDITGNTLPILYGTVLSATEAATLEFTPAANFSGNVTIPYVLTDSNGATSNANINITVTPIPNAVDDPITINEDAPATNVSPLSNDDLGAGTDGVDDVTITTAPTAAQGTLTYVDDRTSSTVPIVNGTVLSATEAGTLQFTPTADFNGPVTIPYVLTDSNGATSNANINITVTPTPDAVDDPIAINEGAPATNVSPLGNDDLGAGTDGVDDVTITTAPTAAQGTLTFVDDITGNTLPILYGTVLSATEAATLEFTPAANFSGPVTIPYVLTDSNGATSNANINITVTPIPNAVDDPITMNEDAPATNVSPLGNDDLGAGTDGVDDVTIPKAPAVDEGILTYTPDGGGSPVTVSNGDTLSATEAATLEFTPTADFNGNVDIPYVLTDSNGVMSGASINITINSVNDAPTATPSSSTATSGVAAPVGLSGIDIDGTVDFITISSLPPASEGVLYLPNGDPVVLGMPILSTDALNLTFEPVYGFSGVINILFTVTDNDGGVSEPAQHVISVMEQPVVIEPPVSNANMRIFDRSEPIILDSITKDGIIIDTVNGIESLHSEFEAITASQIVVETVNAIDSLGSSENSENLNIGNVIADDLQNWDLNRVFNPSTENSPVSAFANTETALGDVVRFADSLNGITGIELEQLGLQTLVFGEILHINYGDYATNTEASNVVFYQTTLADGSNLPDWLENVRNSHLMGRAPTDVEFIELKVVAVLENGTIVEKMVRVYTKTGKVENLPGGGMPTGATLDEQLRQVVIGK